MAAQGTSSNAGSGLSPSAGATGNDRTAGVNTGHDRRPGGYGPRRASRAARTPSRRFVRNRAPRF